MIADCELVLDHPDGVYELGEEMRGAISIGKAAAEQVRSMEFSVLWYSRGASSDEVEVVHHEPFVPEGGVPHAFSVRLPLMPPTFKARFFGVHWLARVRLKRRFGAADEVIDWPLTLAP